MRIILLLLFLVSCGQVKVTEELLDELGFCYAFDLHCDKRTNDKVNDDIDTLQERLDKVESLIYLNQQAITLLQSELGSIGADIQSQINSLIAQDVIHTSDILDLRNLITDLDNLVQQGIAEVIDPCGDGPGFDEVILKLHDNTFIAYFETGSTRFLSVLSNGSYRTTDQQSCRFSINNGNLID